MRLIDHTNQIWEQRIRRINGAYTYSVDLVKYQIPLWEKVLEEDDLISTCPKISEIGIKGKYNRIIQYLHSYPYYNSIQRAQMVRRSKDYSANKFIFISAYKEYVRNLNVGGFTAAFAPMAIDVKDIQSYQQPKMKEDRIIYFGNVIQNKVHLFNKIKRECQYLGLELDWMSNGRFNTDESLTREEILKLISTYKYGIAVGRCAQELMALGVKTMIAGHKFGGLITNESEYEQQLNTNMNGRIITHTSNIASALKNIDLSITKANDIRLMNHAELI